MWASVVDSARERDGASVVEQSKCVLAVWGRGWGVSSFRSYHSDMHSVRQFLACFVQTLRGDLGALSVP